MSVQIELKEIRVRSLDVDFNELSWKLVDTSEDILDYNFQVLRSESPSGPFEPLGLSFQDLYYFIDNTIRGGHRWRKHFYLIRARNISSGDYKDFGPVAKEPEADLIAAELRRHMQLLFREFAGRRCWVLPVRTWGQRCSCWSTTLKQRQRSGCLLCYDTSFVRGYMHPIESWIQFDPSPKTEQQTNVGPQQQSNTTARMCFYPPLKPQDLIIEPENRRWKVVQVSTTEHLRAVVHHELQLHEVPPKDIEFSIPLNLEKALKDLWLSPSRNFYNPQDLNSFLDAEAPGIYNAYTRNQKR